MTSQEFLLNLLKKSKITQERYDKGIAKLQAKETAKVEYRSKKSNIKLSEAKAILDKLIE